ncbi:uncharacterized protein YwqG [Filimonas zeae]|uniref:DUF1963 domain-containing protein n=1 Tax=Filimonas zeae TaxID=1737353 RepID=A0A917IU88_9BACT|nr:DUF1963 domain-containing protein [Filimonas zeae]MDR6339343.1 uncharacterized protein YwqG [Filimonas zeae]GGH64026.1 hypothetical protein GCM10011379_15600 [Filimonas zeae]
MKTASTETLSVQFPDIYESVRTIWESARGEHFEKDEYASIIIVGLNEVSHFDKYKGKDLTERFLNSCLEARGIVNIVQDKTLPVAGATSTIRITQSEEGFLYYFGMVPVNSEFVYLITADCYARERSRYEPLFDETWQSLQYFGNPWTAMKKQKDALSALFGEDDDDETDGEAGTPEIPSFEIPADGKERFTVGDVTFQISLDEDNPVHIYELDGSLNIQINGEAPDYENHPDILNDYEDGKVYLRFSFKQIYEAGVPTGQFTYQNSRDDTYISSLWKSGFYYSLDLNGKVTLKEGWLGIEGYMANTYGEERYPIQVAVRIPQEALDWSKYTFAKLEELDTAPATMVTRLSLTDPPADAVDAALRPLTELENLLVYFKNGKSFTEIPKAIRKLKRLKQLTLSGIGNVTHIPEWIGDLKALEELHISGSKAEGMHPYILQLPLLKRLYLHNNQLGSIAPGLPETLERLVLDNNQLSTVPASWVTHKNLKSLNIQNNPLEHLPAGIENIARLDLETEKKMALLDYTYKGADGKGTVTWNNSIYEAQQHPDLQQILNAQTSALLPTVQPQARAAVGFYTVAEDDYARTGQHRFGGLPDLPTGVGYPFFTTHDGEEKAWQFIAQINCADVAPLQQYLPRTGILYFFIKDQEQSDPLVMYYDGDIATLQSARELTITEEDVYDQNGVYAPWMADTAKYPSIPHAWNNELEDDPDEAEALKQALYPNNTRPAHSINSYVFKQHDNPEAEAVDKLKGKPEDWMVLLRVSSDNNPGFNFWDAGEIYFVIHKSDLAKKEFSNVYCGLESS